MKSKTAKIEKNEQKSYSIFHLKKKTPTEVVSNDKKIETIAADTQKPRRSRKEKVLRTVGYTILMLLWVYASLIASQFITAFLIKYLAPSNLWQSAADGGKELNAVGMTIYSAVAYIFCVALSIFVPWLILKNKTTRDELGLRGLPTWTDLLLAPIGFILFMLVTVFVMALMRALLPGINWDQTQDVGYNSLVGGGDKILAFIALVVIAPVAEETIFRGWLYGKLRVRMPALPAMLAVSALFGFVHGQWNVGVTVFVMSLAMCTLRELTGTIWAGMLVHMIKNGVAFYFLFINQIV